MKAQIAKLKKERNAIILAHNYQPPEIQDVADLCGDSLELSIKASQTDADVILFCGVHFMAESASILSPEKTVLLPRADAGCPMADMISPMDLKQKQAQLGNIPTVTYVNSSAAVKAFSTICCTSANVIKVVESLDANEILMTPDRNLAQYAASKTTKKIHFWDGFCPIHDGLTAAMVKQTQKKHPNALFIAHPECRPEVLALADQILSTSGMLKFVHDSSKQEFIIGTELGLLYPMQKANPDKRFFPASDNMVCADMKKISLDDIVHSLAHLDGEVKVPEDIRQAAYMAVKRMVDLAD